MTDTRADEFLAHYGVAGMKWGKRKLATGYSEGQYKYDRVRQGPGYARKVNKEVGKGNDLATARVTAKKYTRNVARVQIGAGVLLMASPKIIDAAITGKDAGKFLGYSAMNKATQAKGKKAAANVFAQEKGITNYSTVKLAYDAASKTWG